MNHALDTNNVASIYFLFLLGQGCQMNRAASVLLSSREQYVLQRAE